MVANNSQISTNYYSNAKWKFTTDYMITMFLFHADSAD